MNTYADTGDGSLAHFGGKVQCPKCGRKVPPDMMRDYTDAPVSAGLPKWACDADGERAVMEGKATREQFAVALGQSTAAVVKARLLDKLAPPRRL